MKKLIYNENTKEINIIDEEVTDESQENNEELSVNKTKPKGIRNWLEENKIFFDILPTILSFVISIVSLKVSFLGLKTANDTMKIYEKQLEIEEDDREPYFELKADLINENIEENQKEYQYTLKNEGGRISHATALIKKYIEVEITYIEGEKIIEPIIFRAPISDRYYTETEVSVRYNEFDKNFILHEIDCEEDMFAFSSELSNRISLLIMDSFPNTHNFANVSGVRTYIETVYNNYQNKRVKEKYKIGTVYEIKGDKIEPKKKFVSEYDEDYIIYLNEVNKDNMESIAKQAKKEFDRRWNLGKNEDIQN